MARARGRLRGSSAPWAETSFPHTGQCHLGDYEATLFQATATTGSSERAISKVSRNGSLAEGVPTVRALVELGRAMEWNFLFVTRFTPFFMKKQTRDVALRTLFYPQCKGRIRFLNPCGTSRSLRHKMGTREVCRMIEHNAFCNSEPQEDAPLRLVWTTMTLTDWNDIEPPDWRAAMRRTNALPSNGENGDAYDIGTLTAAGIAAKGSPATDGRDPEMELFIPKASSATAGIRDAAADRL